MPAKVHQPPPPVNQQGKYGLPPLALAAPRRLIDMTEADLTSLLAQYTAAEPEPEWMDRTAVAKWLSVSLPTVDRMCREGMPFVRLNGDGVRRFSRPVLRAYFEAQTKAGEP